MHRYALRDNRQSMGPDQGWPARQPGSFGSPPLNRLDRREPILGEVFEAFDYFVSEAPDNGQRGVAASGEHFRRMPGMGACLVFTTADIAYVMKTVLDPPVRA